MFVGMLVFLILFFNFNQLPAAKKGFKKQASLQTLVPSYFVRALQYILQVVITISQIQQ